MDWRPQFKSLDDFNERLLTNWNYFITDDDTVLVVGDIGYYCAKTIEILKSLKGHKILVKGNHDEAWGNHLYDCGVFEGVYDSLRFDNMFVEHIPDETVLHSSYYIHGHHHVYDTPGMMSALQSYYKDTYRLNCCVDLIGYKPVTLRELIVAKEEMIERFKEQHLLKTI